MRIVINCIWPYEFTAETDFAGRPGAVAYFIQDVNTRTEHAEKAPPIEISRENYLAITAGMQAGAINAVARRIDDIANVYEHDHGFAVAPDEIEPS